MPNSKPKSAASSPRTRSSKPSSTTRRRAATAKPPAEQQRLAAIRLRRLRLRREQLRAIAEPAFFLDQIVRMVDEKTGEAFRFHLTDPGHPWFWQRQALDLLHAAQKVIFLKARQIGVTWLCCGYGLWIALTKPGTLILVYRQSEDEAAKLVARIWQQFQGLPEHLRFGVEVVTPAGRGEPHLQIRLRHHDGRISTIRGLPSTESAGHGETAAFVLLDEAAYIKKLRAIWKAVISTIGLQGKLAVVSTGNGLSTEQGDGSFFHRLWVTARERSIEKLFLSWRVHPDRDEAWYRSSPEIAALDPRDRREQYPADEFEAFVPAGEIYYDPDDLDWYKDNAVRDPEQTFSFERVSATTAKRVERSDGLIDLYEPPESEKHYAISVDPATGHGRDYTCCHVIDLATMALAAELHGRPDEDQLAFQLHYLGRWYNTALIAVEAGNGWGQPVIIQLRDGREGRPAYPRLYRHVLENRPDRPTARTYGWQTNKQTRPLIVNQLGKALRERSLPYVTRGLLDELQTFVSRMKDPSPAAMDGCNDDRVMAAAIALELYRKYGHHPDRPTRKPRPQRLYQPIGA